MCYNDKCKIEIKSRIDGSENSVSANGRVAKTASKMLFDYVLDGDGCTLTVNENDVIQERRGGQNIKMVFRKGEQTECFLQSGGFSGTFTVFTHDLQFSERGTNSGKNIYTLLIAYTIGEEKIELSFSAEYNAKVKK